MLGDFPYGIGSARDEQGNMHLKGVVLSFFLYFREVRLNLVKGMIFAPILLSSSAVVSVYLLLIFRDLFVLWIYRRSDSYLL